MGLGLLQAILVLCGALRSVQSSSEGYLQITVPESIENKVMKFVEIIIKRTFEETGSVQPKEEELS